MKTKAIVCIKTDKSLTFNLAKDMASESKTSEVYMFKRIRDAKAFFNQEVIATENMFLNLPFDKTEDEVKDFHMLTYTYSLGETKCTKEIWLSKIN